MHIEEFLHHRWRLPILAVLSADQGSRFAVLCRKLGVTPRALKLALADLMENGWVMPNPGYGHPLRPEYVVMGAYRELARHCEEVYAAHEEAELTLLLKSKWTWPILLAVDAGNSSRFGEIRGRIPGIADSSLSSGLQMLVSHGLVSREVTQGHPPEVVYSRTGVPERLIAPVTGLEQTLRANSR